MKSQFALIALAALAVLLAGLMDLPVTAARRELLADFDWLYLSTGHD